MNPHSQLRVVDPQGGVKIFTLDREITHIGSHPDNDVVLPAASDGEILPWHAQLIFLPGPAPSFRFTNLSGANIPFSHPSESLIPPGISVELLYGDTLTLGRFTLIFRQGASPQNPLRAGGSPIHMEIALPDNRLEPNRTLKGGITLRNLGERAQVRLHLSLEGLPAYCQRIDTPPPLDPGAECKIAFRLYHYGNQPAAGETFITLTATAPEAYPGEQARVSCTVQVRPYYRHQVRLSAGDPASIRLDVLTSPQTEPPAEQPGPTDGPPGLALPAWYLEFVQAEPREDEHPPQGEK
ncbi:MAG: FHA domain-containing protein [Chloroflexi bacterium]|nr:FHA domain-containing protein [Chloroflexota bacterium]